MWDNSPISTNPNPKWNPSAGDYVDNGDMYELCWGSRNGIGDTSIDNKNCVNAIRDDLCKSWSLEEESNGVKGGLMHNSLVIRCEV